jgi:hypothetical protein
MKCYKHYDRDAVSQCIECSKTLCPECTSKYNKPLCDQCVIEWTKSNRLMLIKNIIIMIAVFIFAFSAIYVDAPIGDRFLMSLFFSGIPWGWSFLNKITPNIFLFMPLVGWLIYFGIKLVLSLFIGTIVMPFKIYQIIKGINDSKKMLMYASEQ